MQTTVQEKTEANCPEETAGDEGKVMANEWEKLIERYADGKPICNCRQAYYTPCGHGIDANGNRRTDMPCCQYGCQANQYSVKDYIAQRVLKELGS